MSGIDVVFAGIGIIGVCLLVVIMVTLDSIDRKTIGRKEYESPNRGRH
jgi:hypothetical protein